MQVKQSALDGPLQVAQVLSQSVHLARIASPNLFAGHVATQAFPSKNFPPEHFVQLFEVGPLQVKHEASHILHNLLRASSYYPEGHLT